MRNKYGAIKTWSELVGRTFDSKAEARRGEELCLLEKAGEIKNLKYQVQFILSEKPRISIKIDFCYLNHYVAPPDTPAVSIKNYVDWVLVHEDTKGVLTRDTRTKLAWLKEKYGVEVLLSK